MPIKGENGLKYGQSFQVYFFSPFFLLFMHIKGEMKMKMHKRRNFNESTITYICMYMYICVCVYVRAS